MMRTLDVRRLGLVPYDEALALQQELVDQRKRDEIPDTLLLLQHPHVLTLGVRGGGRDHIVAPPARLSSLGVQVVETGRGGDVTYHGPGQLVAYPVVSLRPLGDDVHAFVRLLERVMIGALAEHGIEAGTIEGLTGVWVDQPHGGSRKIGSIGIHVSRGISTHGLAINVNNDLQPFEWIVPCGIEAARMTSVAAELGGLQDFDAFTDEVERAFGAELGREVKPADPAMLVP